MARSLLTLLCIVADIKKQIKYNYASLSEGEKERMETILLKTLSDISEELRTRAKQ